MALQDTNTSLAGKIGDWLDRLRFGREGGSDAPHKAAQPALAHATRGLATRANKADTVPYSTTIAAHPFFPAFVALWFAALFGLGMAILPGHLLSRLVDTIGLDQIVPAAAPPLGATARALIAIGFALPGAALGLFLARKVVVAQAGTPRDAATPQRRKPADRHPDAPAKRPISALEELGKEGLGPVEPVAEHAPEPEEPSPFLRSPLAIDPATPTPAPGDAYTLANSGLWQPVEHGEAGSFAARADGSAAVEEPAAPTPVEDLGWPMMLERFAAALTAASDRPRGSDGEELREELSDISGTDRLPRRSAWEMADDFPSDPAETEHALRLALDRLGRLSGAA